MKSKKKIDRNKLYFENVSGRILVKYSGELNGSSFNCINLNDCVVFVFDITSQLIIEKCNRCKFYLGPVKFALYVRNSNDCTVNSLSTQLRMRNCVNLTMHSFTRTCASLEECKHLRLGVCRFNYLQLKEQLDRSELDQNINSIFTPIDFICEGQKDTLYKIIIDDESKIEKFLIEGQNDDCPDPFKLPVVYSLLPAIENAIKKKAEEIQEEEAKRKAEKEEKANEDPSISKTSI